MSKRTFVGWQAVAAGRGSVKTTRQLVWKVNRATVSSREDSNMGSCSLSQSQRQTASHSHHCLLTLNTPPPRQNCIFSCFQATLLSLLFPPTNDIREERPAKMCDSPAVEPTSASRAELVMAEACTIGVAVFPLLTALNRAWLPGGTYSNQLLIKLTTLSSKTSWTHPPGKRSMCALYEKETPFSH